MCECVKELDAKLAEYNAALVVPLFGTPRVVMETYKVSDKRTRKPPKVLASYCPFCGEKYENEAEKGA